MLSPPLLTPRFAQAPPEGAAAAEAVPAESAKGAEDGADEDDAPVDAEEAKRRLAAKAKAKPKQLSAAATALAEAKARATKGKKGGADKRTFNQAPKG